MLISLDQHKKEWISEEQVCKKEKLCFRNSPSFSEFENGNDKSDCIKLRYTNYMPHNHLFLRRNEQKLLVGLLRTELGTAVQIHRHS